MTEHALERCKERFPHDDPQAILAPAVADDHPRAHWICADLVEGGDLFEVFLPMARSAFVVVREGVPVTVLTEGMTYRTATGPIKLQRSGFVPGVHRIADELYHCDPAPVATLSSTVAKELVDRSPAHAWHTMRNPKWSKAMDIGTAAHAQVLGYGPRLVAIPEGLLGSNGSVSTKAAKEFCEEVRADGHLPMKQEEVDAILELADQMRRFLEACGLEVEAGQSELTAIGTVEGVPCRCKVDHAPSNPALPLWDIKTTVSADEDSISKAIGSYSYDVQDAHYRATWEAATGEARDFVFVFIEKSAPFGARLVRLRDIDREVAESKARFARETWAQCQREARWPNYAPGVYEIGLPAWKQKQWENRDLLNTAIAADPSRAALDASYRLMAPEGAAE